jgi:hypothetical protein
MIENKSSTLSQPALTKLSADYNSNWPLRSLIQGIPYVGGSLDILLSGAGANYQYQRLEDFVRSLQDRLTRIDHLLTIEEVQPTEPLYDYIMHVFDSVRRTRSSEKRTRFAYLVARQIAQQSPWDEAEAAASLLDVLSDLQIQILIQAKRIQPGSAIGSFSLRDHPFIPNAPPNLQPFFPNSPPPAVRAACSELTARGLLYDEGIGRMDIKPKSSSRLPSLPIGLLVG